MALENEDWLYVGGAAVGGVALGMLVGGALRSSKPVYTGLGRTFKDKKTKEEFAASVWARPDGGYEVKYEQKLGPGEFIEAFTDVPSELFEWPMTAALWADDRMADIGFVPTSEWGANTSEASKVRDKERAKEPILVYGPGDNLRLDDPRLDGPRRDYAVPGKRYRVWALVPHTTRSYEVGQTDSWKEAVRLYRKTENEGDRPWIMDAQTQIEHHPTKKDK